MPVVQIATPFNLTLDFEAAELHRRIFAYLIDLIIMVGYAWIMGMLLDDRHVARFSDRFGGTGWNILIVSVPLLLYSLVSELALHGQTVGKKVMDIRVMNLNGGEPTLSQYIIRWMFRLFEWPLVFGVVAPGYFIIFQLMTMVVPGIVVIVTVAITPRNQRLGDLAANTILVKTRINTSIHDTIFLEVDPVNYQARYPQVMQLSDRDINTIKSVINNSRSKNGYALAKRTAERVKWALKIETDEETVAFLETLLQDYNRLATTE